METGRRSGEMQNGLVPHPLVAVKNQEGYFYLLRSEGFQPHIGLPSSDPPVLARGLPNTYAVKISRDPAK